MPKIEKKRKGLNHTYTYKHILKRYLRLLLVSKFFFCLSGLSLDYTIFTAKLTSILEKPVN